MSDVLNCTGRMQMHVTDLRKKYFIDPRLMAYFAALTVITGLAFVFFSSFSCSVNQDRLIEENKQLSEIASMTAGYVRERVNLQMLFTRTAANQIKVLGGPNEPAAAVILREAVKEGGFESMSIIFPDGHMITTGGEKFNFLKFGNRPNERIVCKNIDGIDYIIFLVPVMINGKAAAQVQGVVKASALDNLVDQKIYGGDGQIQLLRSDGSYILSGGLWNSTGDTGNFFDFIQSVRLNNEINLEEIINRFNSRSELSFGYTYEGLPRLAYFSPLGLEDWYIGVSIKGKTIGSETAEVRKNASMLLLQMGMIFALLIIYIIYMERRSARNISRTGRMTEGLIANVQGGVLKCRMDDRFTYQYLSGSFAEMAGCDSPEEAIKIYDKSFWNSIVAEDVEKTRSSIMGQLNDKGSFEVICRIVRKDGGEICAICKGERMREYDGSYSIYSVMLDITHTQRAIEELRVNEERYRIAMEQANIFVFEYDPSTDTIYNSEKMSIKFNVKPVMENITEYFEILSKDPKESEYAKAFIGILDQVRGGAKNVEASYYRYTAEGSLIYIKTHITGVFDSEGNLIKAVGIIKDITEQNDTKIKYLKSKKYGNILSSLYDRSYEFDATNDRVTDGMEYTTNILGLSPEGPFSPLARIFADRCVHPEDRQLFLKFNSCEGAAELFERKETELDFEFRSADSDKKDKGEYRWNSAHMSIYIDPSDSTLRARIFVRDITESASASEMLKNKAERDSLTSLYNRSKTEELINKTLEEDTVADKTRINALLLIDLDNFKKVNDMMGHLFGDAMLTEVTKILKKTFRSSDIMGRIGGDEFVVFMKDIPNMDIAVKKAKEANNALKFIHKGIADSFSLSISIGIAFSPADGTTFSDLCGRADIALYCSKDTGKGCCNIYNADDMGTEFGRGSTNLSYDEPRRINDETFEENPPKHIFRILYGAKKHGYSDQAGHGTDSKTLQFFTRVYI